LIGIHKFPFSFIKTSQLKHHFGRIFVISQISFVIILSYLFTYTCANNYNFSSDLTIFCLCYILNLKSLRHKIFHAILGLWSLRIARTRENGSIQTPVDGWKFRVKCK